MWIRFVLVPGLPDTVANVAVLAAFAASLPTLERLEVLPFRRLGERKYEQLGLPFALAGAAPPDAALLDRVRSQFLECGLTVF